jgi:quercetin dioxygenase-like cupin family protein
MEAREGRFDELPAEEPYDGVSRCSFDGDGATVTRYTFRPGGRFPVHRHPQEQITVIEEGEVELTVGDRTIRLEAGSWSVVAPDVEHGIRAGEGGAKLLAIVVPRRTSSTAYSVAR